MANAITVFDAEPVERVREFWDADGRGTGFIGHFKRDRDFLRYREFRYRTKWHIPAFAAFSAAAGKQVLEIGCGNGTDGVMFALNGASYTGVDLTAEAVEATRRHFAIEGLRGVFRQENSERLSFANDSFDVVYSFGVLHHTPDPDRAVREIHRVLKPGGTARVMLYHRRSFKYYVCILGYMRARVLLEVLRRAHRLRADRRAAASTALHGNRPRTVWDAHYRNFLREGWSYLKAPRFVHHCTDSPGCPYAFTYTARTAARLFAEFRSIEMSVSHFPLNKYPGASLLPPSVERLLARTIGWHLLIRAVK